MYILALNNHNEEVGMKKLAAAVVILSSLSGSSVWAHEAGEFLFARVRPRSDRPKARAAR
jgi:outer membrane protein